MSEQWHSISDIKFNSGISVSAKATAAKNSPWFSGHFPGEPILPGIAQLSMVFEVIEKCSDRKNLSIKSLKKIKFKSLVKPEDLLDILVTLNDKPDNTYSFKVTSNGNLACSGVIAI